MVSLSKEKTKVAELRTIADARTQQRQWVERISAEEVKDYREKRDQLVADEKKSQADLLDRQRQHQRAA